jgi:aspartate carbamoyltransferase
MTLQGADILSAAQFSREQIEAIHARADEFARGGRARLLDGKLLATIFYEPSVRTRALFQAAMQKLGGAVIDVAPHPGESLRDTIASVAQIADIIVLRHADIGAAQTAAAASGVPVLNAGDGTNENPVQALVDVSTIVTEKQSLDGLRVALAGDLKNDPAAHSLTRMLSLYRVDFSLIAPAALAMPPEITDFLRERDLLVEETNDFARTLRYADVVYMTRVRKEKIAEVKQYEKLKSFSILTRTLIEQAKPNLLVMHPLPRADEIASEVDALPSAAYLRQVRRATFVYMALLAEILQ